MEKAGSVTVAGSVGEVVAAVVMEADSPGVGGKVALSFMKDERSSSGVVVSSIKTAGCCGSGMEGSERLSMAGAGAGGGVEVSLAGVGTGAGGGATGAG